MSSNNQNAEQIARDQIDAKLAELALAVGVNPAEFILARSIDDLMAKC